MININDKRKRGRPRLYLTTEQKRIRKNKNNKMQRDRYHRKLVTNTTKIRPYTKEENQRKQIIKQRQALLQNEPSVDKGKSQEEIQGKNEKQGVSVQLFSKTKAI